jgi:methylmalonyl-CoA carboxyltransferase large subunit
VTGDLKGAPAEPTTAQLLDLIGDLTRRVEWLEASLKDGSHAPTDVPPDVVLAISAAVAAYLGKRATVRQIHVTGSASWAQQGRAAVMGSHGITHSPPGVSHGPHGQR